MPLPLTNVQCLKKGGTYYVRGHYFPKYPTKKALKSCSFQTSKESTKDSKGQALFFIFSRNIRKTIFVDVQSWIYNADVFSKNLRERTGMACKQSLTASKKIPNNLYFSLLGYNLLISLRFGKVSRTQNQKQTEQFKKRQKNLYKESRDEKRDTCYWRQASLKHICCEKEIMLARKSGQGHGKNLIFGTSTSKKLLCCFKISRW